MTESLSAVNPWYLLFDFFGWCVVAVVVISPLIMLGGIVRGFKSALKKRRFTIASAWAEATLAAESLTEAEEYRWNRDCLIEVSPPTHDMLTCSCMRCFHDRELFLWHSCQDDPEKRARHFHRAEMALGLADPPIKRCEACDAIMEGEWLGAGKNSDVCRWCGQKQEADER